MYIAARDAEVRRQVLETAIVVRSFGQNPCYRASKIVGIAGLE